ncbi:hypothetical protein GmHk_18G052321 [Glycine max]|nr:hypothetical protein GmHk_18G052321 [Glycine max]
MRVDALPKVIVTDMDLSLMNVVKTIFPDATNLLCQFHIDKNVKAKCKTLIAQKNAWDYVMEAWESLVDYPCESSFDEYLKNFEMACSPWPMFVDYVCQTWVTISEEMETISKRFEQLDVYGKVHLKSKLREIAYPDMNSMCPPPKKVKTKGAPKKPPTKQQKSTKRDSSYWEYVDVLHSVQNSNSSVKRRALSSEEPIQRRNIPMLDQFHLCIQDSFENIIDVKADGNCSYRAIVALLGIGEESWSLVCNHLHKELTSRSEEYISQVGGIERFE